MSGNNKDAGMIRGRKKTATTVIRVVLGLLFVFSGLIKLNDPLGLVFKIEEYFSAGIFDISVSPSFVVDMAGMLITLEIILGAILLMGRFKTFALWTLLALNAGFTFLTFYSAVTGNVSDCGCFGEAIKLSPWVSFSKNIVILAAVIVLIMWQRFIKPSVGFRKSMSVIALIFAFSLAVMYYVLRYEPIVDFRPYKVGVDIKKSMELPTGENTPIFEHVWTYQVDGKKKKFTDEEEPWNIPDAQFVSRDTRLVSGKLPEITDFSVMAPDGQDITDSLLAMDRVLLITCFNMAESKAEKWKAINAYVARKGIPVYLLSNTDNNIYIEEFGIEIPVCFTDPVTLKTIMRANPGVVELKNGVIVSKRSCYDLHD